MRYENHMLENKLLPFIFHFDIVKAQEGEHSVFGNWHENPEFLFYTKGEGTLLYNKHNYKVAAGDLAIINPDCFHAVSAEREIEYYCLIVDAGFFRENGIPIDTVSYRHVVPDTGLEPVFRSIAALYTQKPPYYCARIRAEVLALITGLTERYAMAGAEKEEFPVSVRKAISYIKANYDKDIDVEDIVKHAGFSRAYFSREFKKYTDVSLVTYLNYVRCSQARVLLGSGTVTVSQAAELCGFRNLSYFSKTYRKLMGALPSEDSRKSGKNRMRRDDAEHMKLLQNDREVGCYIINPDSGEQWPL